MSIQLAPRFTRDGAIALVKAALTDYATRADQLYSPDEWSAVKDGIRLTLEALAAAGAFRDDTPVARPGRVFGKAQTMAELLDAAGIR